MVTLLAYTPLFVMKKDLPAVHDVLSESSSRTTLLPAVSCNSNTSSLTLSTRWGQALPYASTGVADITSVEPAVTAEEGEIGVPLSRIVTLEEGVYSRPGRTLKLISPEEGAMGKSKTNAPAVSFTLAVYAPAWVSCASHPYCDDASVALTAYVPSLHTMCGGAGKEGGSFPYLSVIRMSTVTVTGANTLCSWVRGEVYTNTEAEALLSGPGRSAKAASDGTAGGSGLNPLARPPIFTLTV
mmetsp:Transcript_25560/g.64129  ORF Transcript_25560/g.64129 Transcript_25560/m.64129 type:complete len:241 (+) Transcript_25560:3590-4312(+)